MELQCKRCQHRWNYRGTKRPVADYPLYVTCPRCRTVVKLESKPPRDETDRPNLLLPSRWPQEQTRSIPAMENGRRDTKKAGCRFYSKG